MRQVGTVSKSAEAVMMGKEVVGFVATVFAGQQVRDVTEFLWKSRLGPCASHRASRTARGNACTLSGLNLLPGAPANFKHYQ